MSEEQKPAQKPAEAPPAKPPEAPKPPEPPKPAQKPAEAPPAKSPPNGPPNGPPAQQQAPQAQQRPPAPPARTGPPPDDPRAKKELPPPPRPKPSAGAHFKRSETLIEFAKAFALAQGEMDLAAKDQHNPFFHSMYADMASVVGAIRGPFSKNGLSFLQFPRATEEGIEVETLILHASGEWVSDILAMPTMKIDEQGYGKAITYCCRYALRSIAGVAASEDDGNQATKETQEARGAAIDKLTAAALQSAEAFETAFKELAPDVRKAIQRDLPLIRSKIPGATPSQPSRAATSVI